MRSTLLLCLAGLTAALPARADTGAPMAIVCRGNSKATFQFGPTTMFKFTPDTAGPVTSVGLPEGTCGFPDRAMLPNEFTSSWFMPMGEVYGFISNGQFTEDLESPTHADPYVNRLKSSSQ